MTTQPSRQHGDDEGGATIPHESHCGAGTDPGFTQLGDDRPSGFLGLAEAELATVPQQRRSVGVVVHRLQEEVGRELPSRERHRRVVERRQQFLPFPGQQGRQFRNTACRVLRDLVQDLLEASQDAFDLGGGEPRRVVESRQVQLVATLLDGEAERIVRSFTHPLELESEFAVGVGVVK